MSYLLGKAMDGVNRMIFGAEAKVLKTAFYECIDRDMLEKEVPMSKYKGDVVMVVNVASKWGLTKQNYTEMALLSNDYKSRGLKILAFPCNQFAAQEPGTHQEILDFTKTFDPEMPEKLEFFEKADVNGAKTREVFGFLKEALPNEDGTTAIRWNFSKGQMFVGNHFVLFRESLTHQFLLFLAKFLVDHEGQPIKRFGPKESPNEMIPDINELLKKKEAAQPSS
jgi:glutathione peroxidase